MKKDKNKEKGLFKQNITQMKYLVLQTCLARLITTE